MKKILIVSEHFYPSNCIGARRPSKIAEKLHKRGYKVDIFTRYYFDGSDNFYNNLYAFEKLKEDSTNNSLVMQRKHSKLYTALYHFLSPLRIIRSANAVLKEFKNLLAEDKSFKNEKYDAVFSSFGPLSSLVCGLYYKMKHPETKWICDFRDPVIVKYIHKIWQPLFRIYEKKACRYADAVVAVSNGYLERICRGKYTEKAFMIPNGYDEEDKVLASDVNEPTDFIRITYVGALYGGDRDLSPLFKAIDSLACEGTLDKNKIKIAYAGNEYKIIEEQAAMYNLRNITENYGMLSREECLKLQFSSHMLILSTWNDKQEYGVFPGKLLEYMLIGKPIISLTTGDIPNSEVTQVIRKGNLGIAYEAVCDDSDFKELKNYIKKVYDEWINNMEIKFEPERNVLEKYDYKTLMKKIENLINT